MNKLARIVILGSGRSISTLTKSELEVINNAELVIGLNKFCAYQDLAGIKCNTLYYHDLIGLEFFVLMIRRLIEKGEIDGMTILTNKSFYFMFQKRTVGSYLHWMISLLVDVLRLKYGYRAILGYLRSVRYLGEFSFLASKVNIIAFNTTKWNKGGNWARGFSEDIFHFRGSLGSVINCANILAKGKDIYLVGCDFNEALYFYEEEIDKEKLAWRDHTYVKTKSSGMHSSLMGGPESNFISCIPQIISELSENETSIFVTNKNSGICGPGKFNYKALE